MWTLPLSTLTTIGWFMLLPTLVPTVPLWAWTEGARAIAAANTAIKRVLCMSGSPWLLGDHELNTAANGVKEGAERGTGDGISPKGFREGLADIIN
jgi:hypothetical protein